jgi:xylulose-5-phosphate/fructose-6-phosphate phosphoketolase
MNLSFDTAVLNEADPFQLVSDVTDRVLALSGKAAPMNRWIRDKLIDHREHIRARGEYLPEVREWGWRRAP